ncbi:hypothetical protein GCM10007147_25500 [Nocardiopsis kunsanensis]|uniref:Uncharacterized protein n=1 Tax=Nocardiopsis kunsanensis TaxID=141693 RepID=A0A919CIU7_9ACTN|nr:hypothetical protein [Nocardiopsis kunsanensis]GHD26910.1 hypothetical protein GCM10007147_25500 [Nocardiopsis kunsanensis]
MSPVQVIRTLATASVAGGLALGLIPSGPCGAGWWAPGSVDGSFGWFAAGEAPRMGAGGTCETAMAPVGSWAIALIVVGATLLAGVWSCAQDGPKE